MRSILITAKKPCLPDIPYFHQLMPHLRWDDDKARTEIVAKHLLH